MEGNQGREFGSIASFRSVGSEIHEEAAAAAAVDDKLYVAVPADLKAGKSVLYWAIKNTTRDRTIVLAHVHIPAQLIPMLGGKFPASSLTPQQVEAYRMLEREKMHKNLNEYITLCSRLKVKVEKAVIEMDDTAKGLVELIEKYGVVNLVMGAAADKHFSRKMKEVKSKTAINVKQQANPTCKIFFVCKEKLMYTREPGSRVSSTAQSPMSHVSSMPQSPVSHVSSATQSPLSHVSSAAQSPLSHVSSMAQPPLSHVSSMAQPPLSHVSSTAQSPLSSQSSMSSQYEQMRATNSFASQNNYFNLHGNPVKDRSRHASLDSFGSRDVAVLPHPLLGKPPIHRNRASAGGTSIDPWEGISRSSHSSCQSSTNCDDISISGTLSLPNYEESDAGSIILPPLHEPEEDLQVSSQNHDLECSCSDVNIYSKLQEALKEAENLKNEAYEEYCKRQKAEMNAILSLQKAKKSENLYAKETRLRKETEQTLEREKLEVGKLKDQHREISERLQKAVEQKLELELKIAESEYVANEYEKKLSEARALLHSLQLDYEVLQQERDKAVKEAEEMLFMRDQTSDVSGSFSLEFSSSELKQATQNFSNSLKIGEGGFGSVYKGFLRNTTVAIKLLHPQSMQGRSEFHQEVAVLSRVRHPNLVTLIGACSETFALVYEFLPNGSLEECLTRTNSSEPLAWQVRTRIISEICSALIFIHSNKPHPVVHGDLKPANILLDANFVSKISDFGICRLLNQSNTGTTLYRNTHPKGTFAYIDPEFLATGELTPQSDVYSFGIIILQLLTGKPPFRISRDVQEAIDNEKLHTIIDKSAGDWPFVQAKQLAHLGVRCSGISRRNRPNLAGEVWRILGPLMKALSSSTMPSRSFSSNCHLPSYFLCPIRQEIMRDPHIAADGFTYEAEAIRAWIDGGHDTSPMTNLQLSTCELIPNLALRSAIQEWLQEQQQ